MQRARKWIRAAIAASLLSALAPSVWADPVAGELVYRRQCAMCHSVAPNQMRVGPSLAGIVGRVAGTAPAFRYSPAMRAAAVTWTPQTLDAFLATPAQTVPRTTMVYGGVANAAQRADLISYLESLH